MIVPKATPVIRQYLSIKENCPDAILFFRMGDFYEMFFEDAKTASRILEITLTSRNKKDVDPIPMCGIPAKAAAGYISRLLDSGLKVAICDQMEDPAHSKGLVKRDLVRIITPGMILDNEYLDEKTNNYLLAASAAGERYGISCLDISTGSFRVMETDEGDIFRDEIQRISPREILLTQGFLDRMEALSGNRMRELLSGRSVTYLEERAFEPDTGRERLLEQFKTRTLEGFGCDQMTVGIGAAGAILVYVQETQKQALTHVARIEPYHFYDYLMVDDMTCRNLELMKNLRTGTREGTLLAILDKTMTPMGGRMLKEWMRYPLLSIQDIVKRHDAVSEAKSLISICRELRLELGRVSDLERLGSKVVMGHATARDLVALKQSIRSFPAISAHLAGLTSTLFQWDETPDPLFELADLIERGIREDAPLSLHEGGLIKPGFNRDLDELIRLSRDGRSFLAGLEIQEREATGIQSLKVRYNRVFGYYIEIPKARSESIPGHYIRKQTLVNAERFITEELKAFEHKVLSAQEQRAALEFELFETIRKAAMEENSRIQRMGAFLARIDVLTALTHVADSNRYVRPEINTEGKIDIEDGRHPVVEKMIAGERFIPNTVRMDPMENQILVVTGPNMAGKSTILRQVALLVLMSQMGSFVPALRASISLTDRIFTRVGALDNLSQGQSTFLVEMEETANILNNATEQSLVIMDEIGRGTSTFDGLSIAWAVAEYLHDLNGKGVKTLFATHYHELTELAKTKLRLKNYNVAVKEWNDEIIFLRKLVEGGTNRSYGIQVARLAGVPDPVIRRAKTILAKIENGEFGMIEVSRAGRPAGKEPAQLHLFKAPAHAVLERIRRTDLMKMTPIDAMNLLHDLKQTAEQMGE
ncbi:MAG: DNA mismatch repair protein MutS [Thermodesulfobacteriota bacterium]